MGHIRHKRSTHSKLGGGAEMLTIPIIAESYQFSRPISALPF